MKKLLFALAVLLGLASCKIDRDPSFVVQEMMTAQDGLLVNDLGVKYSIEGQDKASEILALQRVFLTGTAVPSGNSSYDYYLTPYEWYGVNVKDCVTLSAIEDIDDSMGTSPAELTHGWFQGGYVNALVTVSFDSDEDFHGEVNLVFDDARSNGADKLYFILKNKQTGKTWADEDLSQDKVAFGYQFYSFPYSQYVDSNFKGEQTFNMEWLWFDSSPYDNEIPYRTTSVKQGTYIVTVQ